MSQAHIFFAHPNSVQTMLQIVRAQVTCKTGAWSTSLGVDKWNVRLVEAIRHWHTGL